MVNRFIVKYLLSDHLFSVDFDILVNFLYQNIASYQINGTYCNLTVIVLQTPFVSLTILATLHQMQPQNNNLLHSFLYIGTKTDIDLLLFFTQCMSKTK